MFYLWDIEPKVTFEDAFDPTRIYEYIFCYWRFLITKFLKSLYFLKWRPIFDTYPLTQIWKFNNFLWVCWFLGKNILYPLPRLKAPQPMLPHFTLWPLRVSQTVARLILTLIISSRPSGCLSTLSQPALYTSVASHLERRGFCGSESIYNWAHFSS